MGAFLQVRDGSFKPLDVITKASQADITRPTEKPSKSSCAMIMIIVQRLFGDFSTNRTPSILLVFLSFVFFDLNPVFFTSTYLPSFLNRKIGPPNLHSFAFFSPEGFIRFIFLFGRSLFIFHIPGASFSGFTSPLFSIPRIGRTARFFVTYPPFIFTLFARMSEAIRSSFVPSKFDLVLILLAIRAFLYHVSTKKPRVLSGAGFWFFFRLYATVSPRPGRPHTVARSISAGFDCFVRRYVPKCGRSDRLSTHRNGISCGRLDLSVQRELTEGLFSCRWLPRT